MEGFGEEGEAGHGSDGHHEEEIEDVEPVAANDTEIVGSGCGCERSEGGGDTGSHGPDSAREQLADVYLEDAEEEGD